jgi:hypothetical protein
MLSYLGNGIRPELQMAVHQSARFLVNPMRSHKLAIMQIGRYLCDNCERGLIFKVDKTKGLKVNVDTNFAGGWSCADADNADNVLSRTGFVICYANCPLVWCSKLQTEIALSTTEAEYIECLMLRVRQSQFRTLSRRSIAFLIRQIQLQIFVSHVIKTIYWQLLWQNL